MRNVKYILVALSIFFLNSHSFGLTKKQLTPRPPIYGIPAKTLPQGKWIFRGYWILPQYDKMYSAEKGEMVNIPEGIKFSSNSVILKVRYGLTNRLTAIVNLPYVYKKMEKPGITKNNSGIGDLIGALLWKAHYNPHKRFLYSFLLFTKYPTGTSSNLSQTELPLGSGSFDIGAAFLPEKEFGKWDMRWSAFYVLRGKNKEQVDLGNVTSFSWSTAYNFSRNFIAEGTFLYKMIGNNSKNGKTIENTNAHLIQAIPGIQYRINHTFLIQLAMPVTLSSRLTFSDTFEPWIGWYYLF